MTVNQAIYDLIHRLGELSDDAIVEPRVAAQWLNAARMTVLADYFKENGQGIPASMLKSIECVPLQYREACDGCPQRYIDLTYSVLDLPDDIGVFSVQRPGGKPIDRYGAPGLATLISGSRFAGTGYSRVGNRIEIYGSIPDGIKLTLWVAPGDISQFDSGDTFPAPSDIMGDVLIEAEKIGRRSLGIDHDVTNDGA